MNIGIRFWSNREIDTLFILAIDLLSGLFVALVFITKLSENLYWNHLGLLTIDFTGNVVCLCSPTN